MITIQKQTWAHRTVYLLTTDGGSVQLDTYTEPLDDGIYAYIHHLWVEEQHRRKGIGKALLNTAEELARSEGKDAVHLDYVGEDTPMWMYYHYVDRGYEAMSCDEDSVLMKLKLK